MFIGVHMVLLSLCQKCDVQPLFKCLSFTKVNVHWYSHGCIIIGFQCIRYCLMLSPSLAGGGVKLTPEGLSPAVRGGAWPPKSGSDPRGLRALSLGTPHFAAAGL